MIKFSNMSERDKKHFVEYVELVYSKHMDLFDKNLNKTSEKRMPEADQSFMCHKWTAENWRWYFSLTDADMNNSLWDKVRIFGRNLLLSLG